MTDVIFYTPIFFLNLLKVMNKYNLFSQYNLYQCKNKGFILKFLKKIIYPKIFRKLFRQHKYFPFKATNFSELALTLKKRKPKISQNNITKQLIINKNTFTTVHKEVDGPNGKKNKLQEMTIASVKRQLTYTEKFI